MCPPTVSELFAQAEDPVSLVLDAEHSALAEIEHFKLQTRRLVVVNCLRAVLVHKRTGVRIRRLRERMTAAAQLRRAQICSDMEALAVDAVQDISAFAPLHSAIERVSAELAGISEPS